MNNLVSIIIPVYGVENFVEKCVHSLMKQSYKNIEFIFIDDCSPDNSLYLIKDIISQYPSRVEDVKFIVHKYNKGLPSARNSGLQVAQGEYIFHCDGDDWIDFNMIEGLMEAIRKTNSDIAYCDFSLSFHQNERYMHQPQYQTPEDCIRGMLSGKMKFNVWNKLVRTSLYKDYNIKFPDGNSMGEDMTMLKLFCHAKKITYIPNSYYHYVQTNPNAFTKQISKKQLEDIQYNTSDLINYLQKQFPKEEFKRELDFFKLNIKLPFLISLDGNMYDLWRDWFPEANSAINLNSDFSMRIKLLQYAALYKQDWFVKFYNFVVVKFIYGIIYK